MLRLLHAHTLMFRNRVRSLTLADEFKAALFLFVMAVLFFIIYLGAYRLLHYLNGVPTVGTLLVNKLLALVLLTSFAMVAFSALITALNTIFFSADMPWLIASPLPVRTLFAFKAGATTLYSSWMVTAAIAPFLAALARVKHAGALFPFLSAGLLVPFFAIAACIGILLSLCLMRFFPVRRARDLLLLLGIFFMTGMYILVRFLQPERLVRPEGFALVAQYLSFLNAPTAPYLPSWWMTAALYRLIAHDAAGAAMYAALLAGGAALLVAVIVLLGKEFFFAGWAEGRISRRRAEKRAKDFRARSPAGALMAKDAAVFFRDTNLWPQLMILGALSAVYLFSIYKLPLDTRYLQNLISFFNVGLIGFILSAVALRFVFPAVSMEGQSLWLVRSSPLGLRQFVFSKLIFSGVPVVAAAGLLTVVSNLLLHSDSPVAWMSAAAALVMAAGVSALAMGFGSAFPKFTITSVAQIESSAGGLFFMLTAIVYVGVNISLLAWPVRNFYQMKFGGPHLPWGGFWAVYLALGAVNLCALVVPLRLGLASLERREF